MSQKILITGGAGFIGYHLAKRLHDDGNTIVLADNFARGVEDDELAALINEPRVEFKNVDLLSKDAAMALGTDFDVIYHLAAVVGVSHVSKAPYNVLAINIELTLNLLELAKAQKDLSRFMFASTSEVVAGTLATYGIEIPTPETTPFTLPDPSDARSTYALSKIYGESLCYHSGLPFTIFRPHNIYGPRMGLSHVIPELLKKCYSASESDSIEVFSPEHQRAFCYIDDAVEILCRLCASDDAKGQCVNLGNAAAETTIWNVAQTVRDAAGSSVSLERGEVTPGSPERRCPDTARSDELSGYSARIDLATGVSMTFDWYRVNVFDSAGKSAV